MTLNPNVKAITVNINNQAMTVTTSIIMKVLVGSLVSWTTEVQDGYVAQNGTGMIASITENTEISPVAVVATDYVWNGEEYVDLGLSVKWATRNVSGTQPHYYGRFFYHNRISPNPMDSFWVPLPDGEVGVSDVATSVMKSPWRLPTKEEVEELFANTDNYYSKYEGTPGWLFKSRKNQNAIFIPCSGHCENGNRQQQGSVGHYWIQDGWLESNWGYESGYYPCSLSFGNSWHNITLSFDADLSGYTARAVRP